MAIREGNSDDFESIVALYKDFFSAHNIFEQDDDKIIDYLESEADEHELLVYEEDDMIKGALFLVNFGQNKDGSHKLWKFRHFAFESDDIGAALLEKAELRIKEESPSAKVEMTIAEGEPGKEFYLEHDYKEEGALLDHYRQGETCYVLGKSFN